MENYNTIGNEFVYILLILYDLRFLILLLKLKLSS